MPSSRSLVAVLAAALAASGIGAAAPPVEPLPSELKERIEVRLVTIDVVALDADETTVPDLTKDDFQLFVDGHEAAIDTFDLTCGGGAEADPNARHVGAWPSPKDLSDGTRHVVLAFDYLHLTTAPCPDIGGGPCLFHTKSLQDFQHVISAKTGIADEEMMVVALTGGLRVEQPFTANRGAVVDTLHRMEHDISLWNGNFNHVTEDPLFASLRALVTVLRATPGPKAVVFVSAGPGPGLRYELQFEGLAAAASDAQVSFYTVDCMGLFANTRVT